jgi:hypothetical protein
MAVQAQPMRVATFTFAAALVLAPFVQAQYTRGPQPYNPQDPQNYGAPAAQSYSSQQPAYGSQQQGYAPQYQSAPYGAPDQYGNPYPNQSAPQAGQYPGGQYQGGQEQIYQAPPALPEYDQPPAPGDGYIWTPGYWAWGPGGYYWVPGAWVLAPYDGALWTPGYWGYGGSGYFWNAGYWGPVVGFYGGINYGFGYFGTGFCGGYWRDHRFWYNSLYAHVGIGFHNVYAQRFDGIRDIHPGGRSFTTAVAARGNDFRGGSYNSAGRGFAATPAARGYSAPGQAPVGRPAYPGSTYSAMNRNGYSAPVQRSYTPTQSYARPQSYNGGSYSRPAAPSYHASAPAQHFSAPSGGGSHFSGGGGGHASSGGGSHGGGHR